jgi:hypothetical protein
MDVTTHSANQVIPAPSVPSRRSARRVLILLVLANLLLGGALFLLRSPWVGPAEPMVVPAMPAQVLELQERMAAGRHGEPYRLVLSDDELTALAGAFLAKRSDVPFTGVRIAVKDGKILVDGVTRGLAVTVPVRVVGTVGASGGLPRARIEDVSLGDVALPNFARERVLQDANTSLDFSRYDLPVTVDALDLGSGGIVIAGRLK